MDYYNIDSLVKLLSVLLIFHFQWDNISFLLHKLYAKYHCRKLIKGWIAEGREECLRR